MVKKDSYFHNYIYLCMIYRKKVNTCTEPNTSRTHFLEHFSDAAVVSLNK